MLRDRRTLIWINACPARGLSGIIPCGLAASTAFTAEYGTGRPAKRKILYRFTLCVKKSAHSKPPAQMANALMMAMSTSASFSQCLLR
jgi:hypothetical protein